MTESQLKTFLFNLKSFQLKISLWKNQPLLQTNVELQKIYENLALQVTLFENALMVLNEGERFIIETHLICHKTWDETAKLFEEKWGLQNGRSERTYKRIQSRALQKIFAFISSLGAEKIFKMKYLVSKKPPNHDGSFPVS